LWFNRTTDRPLSCWSALKASWRTKSSRVLRLKDYYYYCNILLYYCTTTVLLLYYDDTVVLCVGDAAVPLPQHLPRPTVLVLYYYDTSTATPTLANYETTILLILLLYDYTIILIRSYYFTTVLLIYTIIPLLYHYFNTHLDQQPRSTRHVTSPSTPPFTTSYSLTRHPHPHAHPHPPSQAKCRVALCSVPWVEASAGGCMGVCTELLTEV
jgi:hypothetical protein